jgi:L-ascorbate metabolism protein UlaG (beta-lactamase superfamily)
MRITYYGHSCFLIETAGKRLLLDPFVSGNPLAKAIDVNSIRCDYIFLSHAHQDHMYDLETIAGNNPGVVIVGIWEIHDFYSKKGFSTHPMNIGGWWQFDFGRVKMVAAVHSSSFPDGSYGGNPAGFVFDNSDGVLYFAGDTALTMDMQLIPMTCPALDAAILPIGSNFTMDVNDALLAAEFIRCKRIIGCHYDTFGFVKIDHAAAIAAFEAKGRDLELIEIGASLVI